MGVSGFTNDSSCVLRGNERTLEAVLTAYSQIPPVQYAAPVERWERLPKPKGLSSAVPQSVRQSPPCEHGWTFEIDDGRIE